MCGIIEPKKDRKGDERDTIGKYRLREKDKERWNNLNYKGD